MTDEKPVGEVVAASTRELTAEVSRHALPPAFGSLVRIVDQGSRTTTYALVYQVQMGSIEPNRRATAYGLSFDELMREQPQLFELLRTEFQALVIGYREASSPLRQTLPPRPPTLHAFVYGCDAADYDALGDRLDYLRTVVFHPGAPTDDLLIATLRSGYEARSGDPRFLVTAGQALSRLLPGDHHRLEAILRRVTS